MWRDPRFVIGVLLIAASVLGCSLLVSQARSGVRVYQTTRDIAVGEALDQTNVRVVEARPGSDVYLGADALESGVVAARSMGTGELLPSSAVSAQDDRSHRRLMITVAAGLPDSVGPGTELELWFAPSRGASSQGASEPRLIARNATLIRIGEDSMGLGSSTGSRIEVRLAEADLPAVLEAGGGDGTVSAVPVGG